jgi:hypothetical protein
MTRAWLSFWQVFDSTKGGRAKLDGERETRLGWSDSKRATEDEKYAKQHHGQCWSCEPLLPFDIVQFDPMHGVHNELNVILDEVSDLPRRDSPLNGSGRGNGQAGGR